VPIFCHRISNNNKHRIDYNEYYGKGKKKFLEKQPKIRDEFFKGWMKYVGTNLTDDEESGDEIADVVVDPARADIQKADILFKTNGNGDPMLVNDCLKPKEYSLDDRKHMVRCFVKAHYGM
jgi:hypothetical protein